MAKKSETKPSKSETKSSKAEAKPSKVAVAPDLDLDLEMSPQAAEPQAVEQSAAEPNFAEGFDTIELDVSQIEPNTSRTPTEDSVRAMAKSIKSSGLQNPIVVGSDGVVIQGNTRFLAFRDVLKRKTIPARYARDAEGEFIDSTASEAVGTRLVENMQRTDLTVIEQASEFDAAIKAGYAESHKELAAKLGLTTTYVSRVTALMTKGTDRLRAAVNERKITMEAASMLISRAKNAAHLDALLDALLAASEGKPVTGNDVNAAVPATNEGSGKGSGKRGPKPTRSVADLSEAVPSDVAMAATVVKMDAGWVVRLTVDLPTTAANFARFNVEQAVDKEIKKIDAAKFRSAVEAARAKIG